jgi:hypothetical protein
LKNLKFIHVRATEKILILFNFKIILGLYDISIYDFIQEILCIKNSNLLPEKLKKENFVNILLSIINSYTTPLKYFTKSKALEDLFNLLTKGKYI